MRCLDGLTAQSTVATDFANRKVVISAHRDRLAFVLHTVVVADAPSLDVTKVLEINIFVLRKSLVVVRRVNLWAVASSFSCNRLSLLCYNRRHGGGKRCFQHGCNRSAVGGSTLCTSHGGGRRCAVDGCDKSAQSSTKFCVKHGGGKKCCHSGCTKVARGRTQYCAAVSARNDYLT